MKVFYADTEAGAVIEVECEELRWPLKDADGRTIFENSHYSTAVAAWEYLVTEFEAGLSLGTRARINARAELVRLTESLADDAEKLDACLKGLAAAQKLVKS